MKEKKSNISGTNITDRNKKENGKRKGNLIERSRRVDQTPDRIGKKTGDSVKGVIKAAV